MIGTQTAQGNRLHALLLCGDDRDRDMARGSFTVVKFAVLARRRQPSSATREQAIRHGEIRRLTASLRALRVELEANRKAGRPPATGSTAAGTEP